MHPTTPPSSSRTGSLRLAAIASLGAGAVHAVTAGTHSEHRQAVWAFTVLAAVQLGWGAVGLVRRDRGTALTGAAIATVAIAAWVAVTTVGIGAVEGLGGAQTAQAADVIAAALALVALVGCAAQVLPGAPAALTRPAGALATLALIAAALPGMALASQHDHDDPAHADTDLDDPAHAESEHVDARPYDPALPLRLGGMPGVTPEQVAEAERLVAITLERLPKYADPAVAEADGFRSIGDGSTGHEHYVNWSYIDDEHIFNPDFPESLVYEVNGAEKTLVAAMYMLPRGETLETVPDIGGDLIQWHVHEDLCYTPEPGAHRVGGFVQADGSCRPPLIDGPRTPMIHVWIAPHRCGPFASLEGIAGGRIADGEERLCDHVHGSR
ncbi:MAG TPA: hypothetical protein VMN58_13480 [Acidimicrobiales bacterium]|nr:hypothetical protein [Acidimicrobiales bacterium]